ncbi:hypothetical protein EVAR_79971_1, partial [Eumeta japonica]
MSLDCKRRGRSNNGTVVRPQALG